MTLSEPIAFVAIAWLLDAVFGDPVYRLHPIRILGAWSLLCERRLFALGWNGRLGGVLHWSLVVGGALGAWYVVRLGLAWLDPWLAVAWDLFLAYSLLSMRDLLAHGQRVLDALDDLPNARRQVAMLVARDTDRLGGDGVVRAAIESLSENLTDAVLTPLWALCLFGLPGLIIVKAISNLDSMVGYKDERYGRFGWAAARSDDLIHWIPARLSVPLIALAAAVLRLHPVLAVRAALRYHAMLPSPNSGWSEAACAGALRVRLIGPIRCRGALVTERYMGDPDWPANLDAGHLRRALLLMQVSGLLALGFGLLLTVAPLLLHWV
ncbi:adenosylcobinamide-phosphate synthase CbiB [Thiocystis violacea]|uniref:adenosylcobinamide-phosphate synthase CbiB n=1 Tax=Thiocystis violacea TaxID=13725 RepID=UPI001905CA39|nr:adenosylcobinamide-phosphate synthase CbiB [Thiocystis violacea]MBK1722177.1 cobalamin biosynthesis protein CobD [Thiocystis violacea]